MSVALAAACGKSPVVLGDGVLSSQPTDAGADVVAVDSGNEGPDAGDNALGQFGEPTPLEVVNSPDASDDDPMLSSDMLELYFSTNRGMEPDREDIWRSTRASLDEPWAEPEVVSELATRFQESGCALTPDDLTLYLNSKRMGGAGGVDIWRSTRAGRGEAWSEPEFVEALSSEQDDVVRSISRDGLTLAFSRRVASEAPGYDLYLATRPTVEDEWDSIVAVDELNGDSNDVSPFITPNKLQLFFSSDRPDSDQSDLFSAERPSLGEPFAEPVRLEELNSPQNDADPWLSLDLSYIVFASNRGGGGSDLYEARR